MDKQVDKEGLQERGYIKLPSPDSKEYQELKQELWNIISDFHLQLECEEKDAIKAEREFLPDAQVFNLTEPHNRKCSETVDKVLQVLTRR